MVGPKLAHRMAANEVAAKEEVATQIVIDIGNCEFPTEDMRRDRERSEIFETGA